MRSFRVLPVLAVLATVGSPAFAQRPYVWLAPVDGEAGRAEGPFAILLEKTRELELIPLQVARIRAVSEALVRANEPFLAQIRDAELLEPATVEDREAVSHAREVFDANAREAERQVREDVLTRDQRQEARELIGHFSWAYPDVPVEASAPSAPAARAAGATTLVVENHNYYDANIYAVSGPRRVRLGFVGGLSTTSLLLPETLISAASSGIRFEVRQIPSHRLPLTDDVTVSSGDRVYLRIPPN